MPAFASRYGTLTNQAFLDRAHRDVHKRAPTSTWLQGWLAKLDSQQATRAHVMLELSESAENVLRTRPEVYVTMTYVGMLRRAPDASGYAYWVDLVRKGTSIRSLVRLFFTSAEYRRRFA